MTIIEQIRTEALQGLQVIQGAVTPAKGPTINVSEDFTVALTVRNTNPILTFREVSLIVKEYHDVQAQNAIYATLKGGPQIEAPVNESRVLGPWEEATVLFTFTAKKTKTITVFNPYVKVMMTLPTNEPYATVSVKATPDVSGFLEKPLQTADKLEYVDIAA